MIKGTFLVVGGNSGIGRAIVDILVSQGHKVVICDKEISEDLSQICPCYQVDLRDRVCVEHFSQDILPNLEINNLVYSAGYQENVDILDLNLDSWEDMFRVNVGSAFCISQIVAKNIEKEGSIFIGPGKERILQFFGLEVAGQEGLMVFHQLHAAHGSHVKGVEDTEEGRARAGHGHAKGTAVLHHGADCQQLRPGPGHQRFKAVAQVPGHLQQLALAKRRFHGTSVGVEN